MKAPFSSNFRATRISVWCLVGLLAGCAAIVPGGPARPPGRVVAPQAPPSLGFFSKIKVPSGHEPTLQLAARGVQVFRCEKVNNKLSWRYRLPQAELVDAQGDVVGKHGANFTFEHRDGSRLVAAVVAYDDAPNNDDLRWLLLSARAYGKGAFAGVSHVQRINTSGGMPPDSCSNGQLNQLLRVEFTADFVFYRPSG